MDWFNWATYVLLFFPELSTTSTPSATPTATTTTLRPHREGQRHDHIDPVSDHYGYHPEVFGRLGQSEQERGKGNGKGHGNGNGNGNEHSPMQLLRQESGNGARTGGRRLPSMATVAGKGKGKAAHHGGA
jgi:hypothetical protein